MTPLPDHSEREWLEGLRYEDKFDQVCSGCGASWAGYDEDSFEDAPCTCDLGPVASDDSRLSPKEENHG